eukprot:scaffold275_cov301-Prasinococcus_capsulatus_cf.AAC.1
MPRGTRRPPTLVHLRPRSGRPAEGAARTHMRPAGLAPAGHIASSRASDAPSRRAAAARSGRAPLARARSLRRDGRARPARAGAAAAEWPGAGRALAARIRREMGVGVGAAAVSLYGPLLAAVNTSRRNYEVMVAQLSPDGTYAAFHEELRARPEGAMAANYRKWVKEVGRRHAAGSEPSRAAARTKRRGGVLPGSWWRTPPSCASCCSAGRPGRSRSGPRCAHAAARATTTTAAAAARPRLTRSCGGGWAAVAGVLPGGRGELVPDGVLAHQAHPAAPARAVG